MYLLLGRSGGDRDKTDRRGGGLIKDLGWLRWQPNLRPIIRLEFLADYCVNTIAIWAINGRQTVLAGAESG